MKHVDRRIFHRWASLFALICISKATVESKVVKLTQIDKTWLLALRKSLFMISRNAAENPRFLNVKFQIKKHFATLSGFRPDCFYTKNHVSVSHSFYIDSALLLICCRSYSLWAGSFTVESWASLYFASFNGLPSPGSFRSSLFSFVSPSSFW